MVVLSAGSFLTDGFKTTTDIWLNFVLLADGRIETYPERQVTS